MISLKSEYFERILDGTKPFEFRRVFAKSLDEAFLCVIYVTYPVQAIMGIIYFDKPIKGPIEKILELAKESNYPFIEDVREYLKGKKIVYALPIKKSIAFKKPIALREIQKVYSRFRPPQSFYCLEKQQFLKLKEHLKEYESHNEIN